MSFKTSTVAPDFRIKSGATSIKNSDNFPVAAGHVDGVAERETLISLGGVLAGKKFGDAGLEHASFGDFHELPDIENVGRDAADLHVGVRAGADQGNGHDADDFLGDKRAVGVAGDARRILNDFDGFKRDAAHHFRGRASAQDEGVTGRAGSDEGGLETTRQREHGDEDANRAGDAEDGDDRGGPARPDAAKVVGDGSAGKATVRPSEDDQLNDSACAWRVKNPRKQFGRMIRPSRDHKRMA